MHATLPALLYELLVLQSSRVRKRRGCGSKSATRDEELASRLSAESPLARLQRA